VSASVSAVDAGTRARALALGFAVLVGLVVYFVTDSLVLALAAATIGYLEARGRYDR
jgi:hypothetical protein